MLLPRLIVCFIVGIFLADICYEYVSGWVLPLFIGALCAFLVSLFVWRGRRIFCVALALAFFLLGGALLVNERRLLQVAWSGEEKAYCATQLTNIREKAKSYQVDALIQERKIGENEVREYEVSGDHIQAVMMLPGYTHNIINLSDSEELITLMWANECFDPNHPDTFFEPVK
jgi:predicted membrane metal-binding protein